MFRSIHVGFPLEFSLLCKSSVQNVAVLPRSRKAYVYALIPHFRFCLNWYYSKHTFLFSGPCKPTGLLIGTRAQVASLPSEILLLSGEAEHSFFSMCKMSGCFTVHSLHSILRLQNLLKLPDIKQHTTNKQHQQQHKLFEFKKSTRSWCG